MPLPSGPTCHHLSLPVGSVHGIPSFPLPPFPSRSPCCWVTTGDHERALPGLKLQQEPLTAQLCKRRNTCYGDLGSFEWHEVGERDEPTRTRTARGLRSLADTGGGRFERGRRGPCRPAPPSPFLRASAPGTRTSAARGHLEFGHTAVPKARAQAALLSLAGAQGTFQKLRPLHLLRRWAPTPGAARVPKGSASGGSARGLRQDPVPGSRPKAVSPDPEQTQGFLSLKRGIGGPRGPSGLANSGCHMSPQDLRLPSVQSPSNPGASAERGLPAMWGQQARGPLPSNGGETS